jgi:hypothetical protein
MSKFTTPLLEKSAHFIVHIDFHKVSSSCDGVWYGGERKYTIVLTMSVSHQMSDS